MFGRTKQITYVDVVRAYGAVLEKPAKGVALLRDTADLPYEEGLIKEAICRIAVSGEGTATHDQLKAGFMQLASFTFKTLSPELPILPRGELSNEQKLEFIQTVKEVLGPSIGKNEAIAKRMSALSHEFEARCSFIEVAANA